MYFREYFIPSFIESNDGFLPCPKCRGTDAIRTYINPHQFYDLPDGRTIARIEGFIEVVCTRCRYVLALMPPADAVAKDGTTP